MADAEQEAAEKEEVRELTLKLLRNVNELYVGKKKSFTKSVDDVRDGSGGEDDSSKASAAPKTIESIARKVGLEILHPLMKVSIMIIGNHSAGKSSFINWYCEDDVQPCGMAIETQGFTFITSGVKKLTAPLKGEATIMRYPHVKGLKTKYGKPLVENLTTRVSVSKAKSFYVVDFIDTPGLVDGNVSYPFEVNDAIVDLADYADLIFVFMDPVGQALVSRTMTVTKELNKKYYDKMRYYMTKADTVTKQEDLMKLAVQIAQNVQDHIKNQHGFEIPAIFLPNHPEDQSHLPGRPKGINQIQKLLTDIEITIQQKVQDNLNRVETDCDTLIAKINADLAADNRAKDGVRAWKNIAVLLYFLAWLIPTLGFFVFMGAVKTVLPPAIVTAEWVQGVYAVVDPIAAPLTAFSSEGGAAELIKLVAMFTTTFAVLIFTAQYCFNQAKGFKTKTEDELADIRSSIPVLTSILRKREEYYQIYFQTFTKEDQ
jgi:hypothetical protein